MSKNNLEELTGTSDTIFKTIMLTNKDILKAIVNLCTNKKVKNINILNSEMPVLKFLEMRKTLDIYAENINTFFDIEVTNSYTEYIKNRNLAFGFNVYNQGVCRGGTYADYKPTIVLNLISGNKTIPHAFYESLLKDQYGNITSTMLIFSEFYIDYYIDKYYNKGDEENIIKYRYLIMLGLNKKELIVFNERYGDEIVNKYTKSFLEILKENPIKELVDRETDEQMKINSSRIEGFKDGEKRGEKRGIEKTKVELAKNFKSQGFPLDAISKATGLSLKKIMML